MGAEDDNKGQFKVLAAGIAMSTRVNSVDGVPTDGSTVL
jgi:hypothetical protein